MKVTILIPAYKPDAKIIDLVGRLSGRYSVLIVNDGSGSEFDELFKTVAQMGAVVLSHDKNRGKGAAIKTGITYLADKADCDGVITADADGQHTPEDIDSVADAMEKHPDSFIVGEREFKGMPLRSKFGNSVSCFFFKLATGLKIKDTQTGLRGMPRSIFDKLLKVDGDRYEYEMNVLLSIKSWHVDYHSVSISTVYIDDNKSSHFHPVRDGFRVFSRILKYMLSSLVSTAVDYVVFILLSLSHIPTEACYAGARVVSSTFNYICNSKLVFKAKSSVKSVVLYIMVMLFSMCVGSFAVGALEDIGLNKILAKIIIDTLMFIFNYIMQKHVVFRKKA